MYGNAHALLQSRMGNNKAEGGDCGKLENKVGLIKERQHLLSHSRLWPCGNVGLVLPVFLGFQKK